MATKGHIKMKKPNNKTSEQKQQKVLVVGDWFVDEHWVTGIHRSSSSSRTGQAHYRAFHKLYSVVKSFCGAGMAASLLYQVTEDKHRCFDIYGLGLWYDNDTPTLEEMFDFSRLKYKIPFTLTTPPPKPTKGVKLINLINLLPTEYHSYVCTTRIIRIYHSAPAGDIQYHRIDWELQHPTEKGGEESESPAWNFKMDEWGKKISLPERVDSVVIKDLAKGVVSDDLVKKLAEKYKDAKWFVSTKAWLPSWFKNLSNVDLRLLLIPQIAAQEAIKRGQLSCWITHSGYPDELAFESIETVVNEIGTNHKKLIIIVLPEGFSAIAYEPKKLLSPGKINSVVQTVVKPSYTMSPTGMASIFLPAITAEIMKDENNNEDLQNLLGKSLHATYNWVEHESARIMRPVDWDPLEKKFMDSDYPNTAAEDVHFKYKSFSWEDERKKWLEAMRGIGAFPDETKLVIELWRSMIEVEGYVCCEKDKRKELRKLINEIDSFRKGERKHHVGCLLVAAPGSGKTFLVRQLARSLNLRFLPFNITQMFSSTDLLDCFDAIVTTQAQNREQPVLVFIDEINAWLDNENVYDAFLSPLEDGVYIRGGKVFHIAPCIWLFSGTEDPTTEDVNFHDKSDKKSDFMSRLSLGIMNLKKSGDPSRSEVENVYLGANLIRNEFPDVRYIQKKVLKAFYHMHREVGVRTMKHFVKSFNDIQYGIVTVKNIPKDTLSKFKDFKHDRWKTDDPDDYKKVEIR